MLIGCYLYGKELSLESLNSKRSNIIFISNGFLLSATTVLEHKMPFLQHNMPILEQNMDVLEQSTFQNLCHKLKKERRSKFHCMYWLTIVTIVFGGTPGL